MTSSNSQEYISNIGSGYLHPISRLLETLNRLNPTDPNEVQSSVIEHSYSAAIIILAVLLVESTTNLFQSIQTGKPLRPVEYVKKTYPSSGFDEILTEIFVVRDVIAHGHIWKAQFYHDEQADMKLISADLQEGYGDKKFKIVLNQEERKTHKLGINLFPTKLCREDVMLVLKNITNFLLFLEEKDPRYRGISEQYVSYGGQIKRFIDLLK
jgi:hypothetical protein